MPSPVVALDLITSAMRQLGVLATGEVATADEANDGLIALNDVIETWNIEGLTIYGSLPSTFTTVQGQYIYTIGPTGNWVATRPPSILDAYCTVQSVDFPIGAWTLDQWMAQPIKTIQQQIIERLVYVNDFPNGQIILWPTPASAISVTLNFDRQITQAATLATTLSLPPGYVRALRYAIAVELAPSYGGQDLSAYARSTKSILKRANRTPMVSSFDPALMGGGRVIPTRGY